MLLNYYTFMVRFHVLSYTLVTELVSKQVTSTSNDKYTKIHVNKLNKDTDTIPVFILIQLPID